MRQCSNCLVPNHIDTPYFEMHLEIRKWKSNLDIETQRNATGDFCSIKCMHAFVESIGNGLITRPSD